jgi:hypothetical protein
MPSELKRGTPAFKLSQKALFHSILRRAKHDHDSNEAKKTLFCAARNIGRRFNF